MLMFVGMILEENAMVRHLKEKWRHTFDQPEIRLLIALVIHFPSGDPLSFLKRENSHDQLEEHYFDSKQDRMLDSNGALR
jgi:hypothetical protein